MLGKVVFWLAIVVSIGLVWYCWAGFFLKLITESFKIRFTKKNLVWQEMPDIRELAGRMHVSLHKVNPFGIVKGLDNAYATPNGQIIFGETLLARLQSDERLSLAAHEITHIKHRHSLCIAFLVVLTPMIVFMSTAPVHAATILLEAASISIAPVVFVFVSRWCEQDADAGSLRYTGERATVSCLEKVGKPGSSNMSYGTHPSITERIDRVRRLSLKFK